MSTDGNKGIEILSAGAFLRKVVPPIPMLVDQILPLNRLYLLQGETGIGKTSLAWDIADCVSTGQPVFGTYKVDRPGPVVFFQGEETLTKCAWRLDLRGINKGDMRPLYLSTERCSLASKEGIENIVTELAPYKPRLVVFDCASYYLEFEDASDHSEVTAKIRRLIEFARCVCSVLLVSHSPKPAPRSGSTGSSILEEMADGYIHITSRDETGTRNEGILGVEIGGRDITSASLRLKMDFASMRSAVLPDEPESSIETVVFPESLPATEILILLEDGKQKSFDAIAHAIPQFSPQHVRVVLNALIAEGSVSRVSSAGKVAYMLQSFLKEGN